MVKFSVVMPVKDETDILKLSLPSIYALQPDEVIIPMEPSAESIEMVERIARKCGYQKKTRIIVLHEKTPDWRFRQAYARRRGFQEARNDLILTVDVDIIIDKNIKRYFSLIKGDTKLVSFTKQSYPSNFRYIVAQLIHKVYKLIKHRTYQSFTGLYAFSKKAWIETENTKSLKNIPRGEDTHLHEHLRREYKTVFIDNVKNLCLRPAETSKYQYLMGVTKWRVRKDPLWRVVLHSIYYFRPRVLVGYLKAKFSE